VGHLQVFGSIAFAHVPKANRFKLDPKSVKTIFVGYCAESKAYRLWNAKRWKILVSREMIFYEYTFPSQVTVDTVSGLHPESGGSIIANIALHGHGVEMAPDLQLLPSDQEGEANEQASKQVHQEASLEVRTRSPRPVRMRGVSARLTDFFVLQSFAGVVSSQNEIPKDPESAGGI
jgi:hypothetical protein